VSSIPEHLMYTEEHEYVLKDQDPVVVTVGITDYAQGELGDIVFVDLPNVGESFDQGAVFGTIEAVKAVSELFCPVSGKIVEVNEALDADSAIINKDPYGDGWMVRIRLDDPAELDALMHADDYREHIGE